MVKNLTIIQPQMRRSAAQTVASGTVTEI